MLTRISTDRIGHSSALALSIVIFVSSLILRWYLGYLNAKKKEIQYSEQATLERLKSIEELGDLHPGTSRRDVIEGLVNLLIWTLDFFYTT